MHVHVDYLHMLVNFYVILAYKALNGDGKDSLCDSLRLGLVDASDHCILERLVAKCLANNNSSDDTIHSKPVGNNNNTASSNSNNNNTASRDSNSTNNNTSSIKTNASRDNNNDSDHKEVDNVYLSLIHISEPTRPY